MIINTLVHCSVTLFKVFKRESKIRLTYRGKQKKLYKPKYQLRASLCHVIKREHTNIKHLS